MTDRQITELEDELEDQRRREAENNKELDRLVRQRSHTELEIQERRLTADVLNKDITEKLQRLYTLKGIPEVTEADLVFGP